MFRKMFDPSGGRGGATWGGETGQEGVANAVRLDGAVDFDAFAARAEGYSGADIRLIVKEAAMRPLRRMMADLDDVDLSVSQAATGMGGKDDGTGGKTADALMARLGPVTVDDLDAAMLCTKPSSGFKSELYTKWQDEHGSSL